LQVTIVAVMIAKGLQIHLSVVT